MVFKNIKEGIRDVLFPNVCCVCGHQLSNNENHVCSQCLHHKFEEAYRPDKVHSSDVILPEGIVIQHALWNFDKGGYLQELLHQLKYQRLTGVGEDIGRQLGKSLLRSPRFLELIDKRKVRLLPVPLHPKKRRLRGYNQAFYIANGVAQVTNLHIVPKDVIIRNRNTKTQTGFSLEKRRQNIEGAFTINKPGLLEDVVVVIIDDVFTTGATTFELSNVLQQTNCAEVMIATVAQA